MLAVFVGFAFMANDIVVLELQPMKYLGIVVPAAFEYMQFIAPASACVLWMLFGRRRPMASGLAALLLCWISVSSLVAWANRQVDKVKITTWITSNDLLALELRLGFKVWEQGGSDGNELWIARGPLRLRQLQNEVVARAFRGSKNVENGEGEHLTDINERCPERHQVTPAQQPGSVGACQE